MSVVTTDPLITLSTVGAVIGALHTGGCTGVYTTFTLFVIAGQSESDGNATTTNVLLLTLSVVWNDHVPFVVSRTASCPFTSTLSTHPHTVPVSVI